MKTLFNVSVFYFPREWSGGSLSEWLWTAQAECSRTNGRQDLGLWPVWLTKADQNC